MVKNTIKVRRAEVGISQAALAERMPDVENKVVMSFIEAGRCLPTRHSLEVMCETFGCTILDIYDASELDLLSIGQKPDTSPDDSPRAICADAHSTEAVADPFNREKFDGFSPESHKDMEQLRVWMPTIDKLALTKAIKGLGYRSTAEWLREMQRNTIQRYIALKIESNISTDALKHPLTEKLE